MSISIIVLHVLLTCSHRILNAPASFFRSACCIRVYSSPLRSLRIGLPPPPAPYVSPSLYRSFPNTSRQPILSRLVNGQPRTYAASSFSFRRSVFFPAILQSPLKFISLASYTDPCRLPSHTTSMFLLPTPRPNSRVPLSSEPLLDFKSHAMLRFFPPWQLLLMVVSHTGLFSRHFFCSFPRFPPHAFDYANFS